MSKPHIRPYINTRNKVCVQCGKSHELDMYCKCGRCLYRYGTITDFGLIRCLNCRYENFTKMEQ